MAHAGGGGSGGSGGGDDASQRKIHDHFVESLLRNSNERIEWTLESKVRIRAFCALHRLDKKSAENDLLLRDLVKTLNLGGYDPFAIPGDWANIRLRLLSSIKYHLDRWTREGLLTKYFDTEAGATKLRWPDDLRGAWMRQGWHAGHDGMSTPPRAEPTPAPTPAPARPAASLSFDDGGDVIMRDSEDARPLSAEQGALLGAVRPPESPSSRLGRASIALEPGSPSQNVMQYSVRQPATWPSQRQHTGTHAPGQHTTAAAIGARDLTAQASLQLGTSSGHVVLGQPQQRERLSMSAQGHAGSQREGGSSQEAAVAADLAADLIRAELAGLPMTPKKIVQPSSPEEDEDEDSSGEEDSSSSGDSDESSNPSAPLREREAHGTVARMVGSADRGIRRRDTTQQAQVRQEAAVSVDAFMLPARNPLLMPRVRQPIASSLHGVPLHPPRSPPAAFPRPSPQFIIPQPPVQSRVVEPRYPATETVPQLPAPSRHSTNHRPPPLDLTRLRASVPQSATREDAPASATAAASLAHRDSLLARVREAELRARSLAALTQGTPHGELARLLCGAARELKESLLRRRQQLLQHEVARHPGAGIALGVGDGHTSGGLGIVLRGLP